MRNAHFTCVYSVTQINKSLESVDNKMADLSIKYLSAGGGGMIHNYITQLIRSNNVYTRMHQI